MINKKYSKARKAAAVLLLCALALLFLVGMLALVFLQNYHGFEYGYEAARREMFRELGQRSLSSIGGLYFYDGNRGDDIYPNSNLRFSITLDDGTLLYSNEEEQALLWAGTMTVLVPADWQEPRPGDDTGTMVYYEAQPTQTPVITPTPTPISVKTPEPEEAAEGQRSETPAPTQVPEITPTPAPTQTPEITPTPATVPEANQSRTATIHACVSENLTEQDEFSVRNRLFSMVYRLRYMAIGTVILSLLLGIAIFSWLLKAAGRREDGSVTTGPVERIPYDVFTLLCLGVFCIPAIIAGDGIANRNVLGFLFLGAAVLLAGLVILFFCMSTAVRLKTHTLWNSCLVVRLLRWAGRKLSALGRILAYGLRQMPMIRRDVLLVMAVWVLEAIVLIAWIPREMGDVLVVQLLKVFILFPVLCWILSGAQRLRNGAKALAAGDLGTKVNTDRLPPELKEHAEDLNRIAKGMNAAVEERLKSERLRTELITNVSHDIKTPLTSIINYVDLLAKTEPEDETVREYLEVLSRQSSKLKKLIEDLIEASKASTGNLTVHPEPCDLTVLMQQMAGEYAERMEAIGLIPVVTCPDGPVVITADGRHMWRIFDNLLNNVCKYAQPETRVYLDMKKEGDQAVVTFRNISREPLKQSADELTERFTRGDSSRSTEGNGLGLAIADSLTRLQGGEMKVILDGDLFKVLLEFPLPIRE